MSDLNSLVALNMTHQIGVVLYRRLVSHFGSAEQVLKAAPSALERVPGIGPVTSAEIVRVSDGGQAERELEQAGRMGIKIIPHISDEYPLPLKNLYDHPLVLYVHGKIKREDLMAVGIVGSRECTAYGRKLAEQFARELGDLGICVVSGLARGVDTWAHAGALKSKGGRTLAVLGSGLNRIYPPENQRLYDRIVERGAAISEFPLNARPEPSNFPRRNRIISGLSLGVLVVEANERSGALITADWALEQNKEVFCIPGSVDNPLSKGCHKLIKQGAKLAESVEDILEELPPCRALLAQKHPSIHTLPPLERIVCQALSRRPQSPDQIASACRLAPDTVETLLARLASLGLARENDHGYATV